MFGWDVTKILGGNLQTQHICKNSCKDGTVKSTTWKELRMQVEVEENAQLFETEEGRRPKRKRQWQ